MPGLVPGIHGNGKAVPQFVDAHGTKSVVKPAGRQLQWARRSIRDGSAEPLRDRIVKVL